MKMKRVKYIYVAMLLLGTTSCADMLDRFPLDSLAPETYYNNEGEWDSLKGFPFLLSLSHSPLPTYAFIPHRHLQYYPKLLIRYWDNDIPVCFLKKRPKDD